MCLHQIRDRVLADPAHHLHGPGPPDEGHGHRLINGDNRQTSSVPGIRTGCPHGEAETRRQRWDGIQDPIDRLEDMKVCFNPAVYEVVPAALERCSGSSTRWCRTVRLRCTSATEPAPRRRERSCTCSGTSSVWNGIPLPRMWTPPTTPHGGFGNRGSHGPGRRPAPGDHHSRHVLSERGRPGRAGGKTLM